ncbi:iron-containing redox enzyme family protein [Pollutimonas bauzanensis]|uniref:Iron-containing redox enzyme n=1 Tax=Pollutimonas bauzanensis TaxID=658167 RepID=A0A1M5ZZC4_9BURK|nr:iron-containing redox enzyme family protein [Pollutimonas bauzanensis]SHI29538.1 Iron-containing redox enzyme [Pollutimonas bauzanensis]
MTSLKVPDLDSPRRKAIAAMRASISAEQWNRNHNYVSELRAAIYTHRVTNHPAIAIMNSGRLNRETMRRIHLEYRHAIVQIFTDALLAAQLESRQLESRLAPASKMAGRFLLTLNVLDEFGFRPGLDAQGYYRGNPAYAHYPLFEKVLDAYGITERDRLSYRPSKIAMKVRAFLEDSYPDYATVSAMLAVAEQEVILFTPALRKATEALGIDVNDGYYHVHGVSDDDTTEAADDDHEDDLWFVLIQAIAEDQQDRIKALCMMYCDLWARFWDEQIAAH